MAADAAQLQVAALLPQPVAADYLEDVVGNAVAANALRTYATSMWQILTEENYSGSGGNGDGSGVGSGYGNGDGYGNGGGYGSV